jgi:site-specific recombinase XerD
LRRPYATWLVDDGVPPNIVARVMGHEKITTTLQLYTCRTDDESRILALTDEPGRTPLMPMMTDVESLTIC